MSIISILGGDFEILFEDETVGGNAVAGMKMVRRAVGAGPTVYETNALYSAIAESTDEFTAMGFSNPMLPVTPNAYTMEDFYFIPRSSTEFLKGGAIDADWTQSGVNGVIRKEYAETAGFVAADIGRQVLESASGPDAGTLLDFEVEPDGTTVVWIRPDTATDLFDATSGTIEVTTDGGTGAGNVTVAAISGRTLYPSVQAIGSVPTATEVYLYQDRVKMTDSTGGFQWWATDAAVSLGIIDILVRVINAGVTIADGDVEVFSRRYTSQYDNFRLNVVAGGRSALPLASAADINNTTGYRRTTLSGSTGTWDAGNGIYNGATWATATARGVITVGGTGGTPTIEYYLVGDLTDLSAATVTEYDFVTAADDDGDGTAGAPAPNLLGPTDSAAGEGGTVTVALGFTGIDHDGNGSDEFYSMVVDSQGPGGNGVTAAKTYERLKYITRRGASAADLFSTPNNILGEAYRGLVHLFEYDASTGTLGLREDLFTATGGNTWTGVLASQNTTSTPDYITVLDEQTSIDSVVNDDVIEDEGGTEDVTVHGAGSLGIQTIVPVKSAPFGTFTGTVMFGAPGVAFINPEDNDTQNYILTDDLGNLITPPNTVTFNVTNTLALDRVMVARDTGTAGIIDKDQFGGIETPAGAFNGVSDLVIRAAGTVDDEVPPSGYVRIVHTTLQEEHNYVYDTRTTGALGEFNLRVVDIGGGTFDAGSGEALLVTDDAGFDTAPAALPGMLVHNTTNGDDVYEVVSVTDDNNIIIKKLYGAGTITVTDTFTLNALIGDHTTASPADYTTADNLFDLILDTEAVGATTSNSFVKLLASNFNVVVNVRQGKIILPFTTNPVVNDAGGSAAVVRAADTIAV